MHPTPSCHSRTSPGFEYLAHSGAHIEHSAPLAQRHLDFMTPAFGLKHHRFCI